MTAYLADRKQEASTAQGRTLNFESHCSTPCTSISFIISHISFFAYSVILTEVNKSRHRKLFLYLFLNIQFVCISFCPLWGGGTQIMVGVMLYLSISEVPLGELWNTALWALVWTTVSGFPIRMMAFSEFEEWPAVFWLGSKLSDRDQILWNCT